MDRYKCITGDDSLEEDDDGPYLLYADAQATVEALQRERDALKLVNETHMKTVMTLSHIVERSEAALDAEREKGQAIIKDTKNMLDVATRSVREELTQLKALVRAFIEAWDHDGEPSAVAYEDAVARARATLDATTPAGGGQDEE